MTNEKMLEIFEESGAVLSGHFLLTSGRHSARYMQCAKLFTNPELADKLCSELAKMFKGTEIELVVSPAIGGIIMGYCMAKQLRCLNVFAERTDGQMSLRRGFTVAPGQKVLVVEDVVTTGGSVKEVIELCRDLGADVVAVASIVDRSNGTVDFNGLRFESLLTIEVTSYEQSECPICAEGKLPLIKPGSRANPK